MALELKIQNTAVTATGDAMTVTDITGDYDGVTNTTGYGGPNKDRNELALFLKSVNKRTDADVDLVIDNSDPLNVTEWAVSLNKDGWDQTTIFGLNLYSTSTNMEVGEIAYDSGSGEFRKIETKSGAGPYSYTYTVVTINELGSTGTTTFAATVEDLYDLTQLNKCNFKANKKYYNTKELKDRDKYIEIRSSIIATKYQFELENPSKAQEMVESLEVVCECFSSDTCQTC